MFIWRIFRSYLFQLSAYYLWLNKRDAWKIAHWKSSITESMHHFNKLINIFSAKKSTKIRENFYRNKNHIISLSSQFILTKKSKRSIIIIKTIAISKLDWIRTKASKFIRTSSDILNYIIEQLFKPPIIKCPLNINANSTFTHRITNNKIICN